MAPSADSNASAATAFVFPTQPRQTAIPSDFDRVWAAAVARAEARERERAASSTSIDTSDSQDSLESAAVASTACSRRTNLQSTGRVGGPPGVAYPPPWGEDLYLRSVPRFDEAWAVLMARAEAEARERKLRHRRQRKAPASGVGAFEASLDAALECSPPAAGAGWCFEQVWAAAVARAKARERSRRGA
ncbi:hypothetical protein HYH03_015036 [Edaphochlamys debaryana]|uniref:Uncharacterized protein n=1 Tax=Edaphochlamys debaryana TaxID=47281 RepID=A0A835XKB6_9CHLO|nr:hypothetical protein HYH03_015036 [Edaphochlamys debaryana]|eukprot:KAG2486332.1 hypothetical protein HYH03_015036 [Edaphochlamys debaryana]